MVAAMSSTARRWLLLSLVLSLSTAGAVLAQSAGAASLVADYRFQDTHASSVGSAPPLTDLGSGNAFATETVNGSSQRVLTFPEGGGLQLATSGLVPSDAYSVIVLFRFANTSSYRRILDATNSIRDNGLYVLDGHLDFFDDNDSSNSDHQGPSAVFADNTYAEVAFTRDAAKQLVGYVNGTQQFTYTDSFDQAALSTGSLIFFTDDQAVGGEASAGAVAHILVYDGPLTPAEVSAIFSTGGRPSTAVQTGKAKAKKGKKGSIIVKTGITGGCPTDAVPCPVTATVDRKGKSGKLAAAAGVPKSLGKTSFDLAPGASQAVKVKLSKKGAKALNLAGKLKATISVSVTAPSGAQATATRNATLKTKKKH